VDCRAWRHDRHTSELVPGHIATEVNDGQDGLRRRRQSRSTLTHGKDAKKAKAIELAGWDYPRHLAGRLFAVAVRGDVEGAEAVRRAISDWLRFMDLCPAGPLAELDRYIGYWKPYATSHDELDHDEAVQEEVRNAARTLLQGVKMKRAGKFVDAGQGLKQPRQK
jgi:multimeric flavodoxin WrbA